MTTNSSEGLRFKKISLNHGKGAMPALGFGTLIPDPAATKIAVTNALRTGFRHLDCAERYKNEREVGQALSSELAAGTIKREEVFITTKLWNTNHRPERVGPAFAASCERLGVKYIDLYLSHTPFAFQPGDNMEPRDAKGEIIYDQGVTMIETWRAMEKLVDQGKCGAIGVSDVTLENFAPLYDAARIKPAVVQVESHPYLPQTELLDFCNQKGVVLLAFAPLGHGARPGPLEDPAILAIARQTVQTPAQVLLAWGIQRGTAVLTTAKTLERARENYNIAEIPPAAVEEISRIQTRQRLEFRDHHRCSRFHTHSGTASRQVESSPLNQVRKDALAFYFAASDFLRRPTG